MLLLNGRYLPLIALGDGLDGFLDPALDGLVLHALLDELDELLGKLLAGEGLGDGAHEETTLSGTFLDFLGGLAL